MNMRDNDLIELLSTRLNNKSQTIMKLNENISLLSAKNAHMKSVIQDLEQIISKLEAQLNELCIK